MQLTATVLDDTARRRGLHTIMAVTFLMNAGFFLIIPLVSVHYVGRRAVGLPRVASIAVALARAGVSHAVPKVPGLVATFGGRMEGVPVRDLLGSSNGPLLEFVRKFQ